MWRIIGQTRAVSLLQRSLERGSPAHAYLFVGPHHVGKMTLALKLAQALNCEAAEPPCGDCASCDKIASARHAAVQIIGLHSKDDSAEAKSQVEISIDQIRQMQHSASMPPFEGRCKVFIINATEFLSIEAANCLLKTLEEPVDRVFFILLTTNERLLPATVVYRCQRVELFPLAVAELEAALREGWHVEPQRARLLARLSHGCLGWAVSVALDDRLLQQRAERLDEVLDNIGADCESRFAYVSQLVVQSGQNRGLIQERLDLWLDWWRDMLLVKAGSGGAITNADRLDVLTDMARGYGLAQVRTFIKSIFAAEDQLRRNANPRLVLEVLMLNIPEAEGKTIGNPSAQFEVNYG